MALDMNGLSAYVDENKLPLIKKSILGGRTLQYITVQPDIKSAASINIIDSTLVAQAGGCGWSASGTTALTQRDLSVCPIKVNEPICVETLEAYYTQKMVTAGSAGDSAPEFETIYADEKAGKIAALIDDLIWKGDTVAGSGNLALCDGYLALFNGELSGDTVDGNVLSVTAITSNNVIDVVDGMVSAIPTDIIDNENLVLFMGYDVYRTWATALRNANLFHYNGAENQGDAFSQMVAGSNVKVVAVRGLNGTNQMVLSTTSNLYFGTDLLNDFEDFKLFFAQEADEMRFSAKWKQGVNVAFPGFVVHFAL